MRRRSPSAKLSLAPQGDKANYDVVGLERSLKTGAKDAWVLTNGARPAGRRLLTILQSNARLRYINLLHLWTIANLSPGGNDRYPGASRVAGADKLAVD